VASPLSDSGADAHSRYSAPNRTLPDSARSRFPSTELDASASNIASVETGPTNRTGLDRNTSRERSDGRGAHERVFTNTDGTETTEFSATPLNYRDRGGNWVPIDTTLTPTGAGWANDRNSAALDFAATAADPTLAIMRFGDHELAYGLEGAAPMPAKATQDSVTYPGVLPGVDLTLEARPGAVKETLILPQRGHNGR
jgi:hypothetical protein